MTHPSESILSRALANKIVQWRDDTPCVGSAAELVWSRDYRGPATIRLKSRPYPALNGWGRDWCPTGGIEISYHVKDENGLLGPDERRITVQLRPGASPEQVSRGLHRAATRYRDTWRRVEQLNALYRHVNAAELAYDKHFDGPNFTGRTQQHAAGQGLKMGYSDMDEADIEAWHAFLEDIEEEAEQRSMVWGAEGPE